MSAKLLADIEDGLGYWPVIEATLASFDQSFESLCKKGISQYVTGPRSSIACRGRWILLEQVNPIRRAEKLFLALDPLRKLHERLIRESPVCVWVQGGFLHSNLIFR